MKILDPRTPGHRRIERRGRARAAESRSGCCSSIPSSPRPARRGAVRPPRARCLLSRWRCEFLPAPCRLPGAAFGGRHRRRGLRVSISVVIGRSSHIRRRNGRNAVLELLRGYRAAWRFPASSSSHESPRGWRLPPAPSSESLLEAEPALSRFRCS